MTMEAGMSKEIAVFQCVMITSPVIPNILVVNILIKKIVYSWNCLDFAIIVHKLEP
jgi:hypothetical protein